MTITIKSITIYTGRGGDRVSLHADLPSGVYPYDGVTDLAMYCAAGTAENYCAKHFPGVPIKVVIDA